MPAPGAVLGNRYGQMARARPDSGSFGATRRGTGAPLARLTVSGGRGR